MAHDRIVEPWRDRCTGLIERPLPAPDRHDVASTSRALCTRMRPVARDLRQAKSTLEAPQRQRAAVTPCCPPAGVTSVHTRTVRPATVCGEITIPVRTFQCRGGDATCRPDDRPLGVPEVGACTDDVRWLSAPGAAEWPHRVANARFARCTGGALSSRGAQGLRAGTARARSAWPAERVQQETEAVAAAMVSGDSAADLRVEIAMDGVTAHLARRRQPPQGATILVHRLAPLAAELATRIPQVRHAAGWAHLPLGAIRGDGAPWSWNVAAASGPGVRQTLDDAHRRAHLSAVAPLLYPNHPTGAKAGVEQQLGTRLTDRIGEGLGARKRIRPWKQAIREARAQLIGSVERNRTRIRDQQPWHRGRAVGAGAVAGACKHVMHVA